MEGDRPRKVLDLDTYDRWAEALGESFTGMDLATPTVEGLRTANAELEAENIRLREVNPDGLNLAAAERIMEDQSELIASLRREIKHRDEEIEHADKARREALVLVEGLKRQIVELEARTPRVYEASF